MSITVGFFNKQNNKKIRNVHKINILTITKYLIILVILIVLSIIIGRTCLKSSYISNNILNVACNIRQADKKVINKEQILIAMNNNISPFDAGKSINEEKTNENVENVDKEEKNSDEFDVSIVDVDSKEVIAKKTNANLSINNTDNVQKINIYDMVISNYSSRIDIDFLSLFEKNIVLTKKSDPVLIYSTHTSESYTNSERYKFEYSSTYRTRDAKYNMLSVGNILARALEENNMNVIFDTTPHDYGNYEIAYTNSRKTIENQIAQNERIGLAIDVHRDALGDLTNGPTVEINGQKVAKLMFVMGIGTTSYANEYWENNLALALKLQKLGEEMYPGLFRGMIIRNSKYNQDLIKNSFLIEVGTTGNTLEEAYFAARCLANILNKFYNN